MADATEVEAAAALYAAAQLECLGVLQVCDRLVELYLRGGLPIGGPSAAAALLDSYWLGRAERLGEDARRTLYAEVVGPGFEHLLERLALALAEQAGGGEVADPEALPWAAGELRANIAAHVGEAEVAAIAQLHAQFADALAILSEPDLLAAYGARDPWQLTTHLARIELGSEPDIPRHQALAAAGATVLAWLADGDPAVSEDVGRAAITWVVARFGAPDA
jgi:hypothetical protein